MLQNRETSVSETIIRFFSFFTILTNILVALFFTTKVFHLSKKWFGLFFQKGTLIALTTFILIVGLVYQIMLRDVWEPTGLQRIVDELLHTIIPLYTLIYWYIYLVKNESNILTVLAWLLYPVIYIVFILIRGHFSDYYPYPFLDIPKIGIDKTLINTLLILALILFIMSIFILIERKNSAKVLKTN